MSDIEDRLRTLEGIVARIDDQVTNSYGYNRVEILEDTIAQLRHDLNNAEYNISDLEDRLLYAHIDTEG